jgi:hypothetical protein
VIDTQPFHDEVIDLANEPGIQQLTEEHRADLELEKDAKVAVEDADNVVRQLSETLRTLGEFQKTLREDSYKQDLEDLDGFIAAPDLSRYQEQALARAQRRASLDWAAAGSGRIVQTHLPGAALNRLRAQVALKGAQVKVQESSTRLLIANKLLLLKPIIEAEGSNLTMSGGLSDESIGAVLTARAKHAEMSQALATAEQLFEQNQTQLQKQ